MNGRTVRTTKMPSWWRKAVAGFVAGLLLGCATPPGEFGKSAASAPERAPAPGQVAAPALPEHKVDSKSAPALAHSPAGLTTAPPSPNVQAEPGPGPTVAPVERDGRWTQRGRASWYGKQFNGRRTANGERFNAMTLTAAHRSLPIPSYARVRVVGSGKEVVVRINDRGPFHGGRVLDVSYAAARQLGIVGLGTALVDIAPLAADYVPPEDGISDGTTQSVP